MCGEEGKGEVGGRGEGERGGVVVVVQMIEGNGVSVQARSYVHLIVGAVSLWTRPPALYLCTGP